MRIISLKAENFKKLHAIEITPDGNFVQITGRNGQGKSSTLDAIWVAMAGLGVAPKEPIRKGAESARIRLDLGEIKVTRHFKHSDDGAYTSTLTVESAEGARFPSPQKLLDSLLGALSFDPLAFSRMDATQQFDTLRKFVPGVDFDALDRAHAGDYQRRTEINRRLKEAKASAEQIRVTDAAPVQPIDESELVTKLKDAGDHNADIEKRRALREAFATRITDDEEACAQREKSIFELEVKLTDMRAALEVAVSSLAERKTRLASWLDLPAMIDTAAVAAQLNEARANNRQFTDWQNAQRRRMDLLATAKTLAAESEDLSKKMLKRLQDKQAAIAAAALPITGISFGEGTVLLNDLPFDQASDAEKLRASVEMAMAANPKLQVVRIRDGSLLDEEGLRLVAEMADARGCQVWLERVSDGNVGIVLENGYIKGHEDVK